MAGGDLRLLVSLNNEKLKQGLNDSKRSVKGFGRTLQTAMGFSLARMAAMFVNTLKSAVVEAAKVHAQFERIELTLGKLTGTKVGGKILMDQLREFSVKTPFTPEDVFKASRILMSFGFTAREQTKNLKMLGDMAAVSGKPLEELAFIYGKVFSRGRAQARELNQLIRAQIPISREVAKVMGVTESQVRKLTEQGKVSFAVIEKAMQNLTSKGGQFYGMTADSAKTLEGRWSTFVGVLMDAGDSFARIFSPEMKEGLNGMIQMVEALNEALQGIAIWAKENGGIGQAIANALNPMAAADKDLQDIMKRREKQQVDKETAEWLRQNPDFAARLRKKGYDVQQLLKAGRSPTTLGEELPTPKGLSSRVDRFFGQGQFMFNPAFIPGIDVQEHQLSVLQQIETHMRNSFPGASEKVIRDTASRTFNRIKKGVGE